MSDSNGRLIGWRRWAVPASLLLSYLFNDGEEVLTMASSASNTLSRAPGWIPTSVRNQRLTQKHINVAIAFMGLLYVAAAIDGYRTAGRGRLYQEVQMILGLHGFSHIAGSIITRDYTSGVITSPTVVIPQGWWALRTLRRAGVPIVARLSTAAPLVLAWLALSHAVAHLVATCSHQSSRYGKHMKDTD